MYTDVLRVLGLGAFRGLQQGVEGLYPIPKTLNVNPKINDQKRAGYPSPINIDPETDAL